MNERIQELAKQAFTQIANESGVPVEKFTDRVDQEVRDQVDQRFAELIVKECISKVVNHHGDYFATQSLKWQMGCRIQEYFGVE